MVAMVDSFRANVLNKWVATLSFHTTLRTYWTLVPCLFSRFNWFNKPRSWIILRWVFRRAQASCSLELELYASAIINCVHTNERSINVMLQPFDWMNTHNLCIFALKFCSKLFPVSAQRPEGPKILWEEGGKNIRTTTNKRVTINPPPHLKGGVRLRKNPLLSRLLINWTDPTLTYFIVYRRLLPREITNYTPELKL